MIHFFSLDYDKFWVRLQNLTPHIQKYSDLLLMKLIASYAELTFTIGMMGPKISSVITCNKIMYVSNT